MTEEFEDEDHTLNYMGYKLGVSVVNGRRYLDNRQLSALIASQGYTNPHAHLLRDHPKDYLINYDNYRVPCTGFTARGLARQLQRKKKSKSRDALDKLCFGLKAAGFDKHVRYSNNAQYLSVFTPNDHDTSNITEIERAKILLTILTGMDAYKYLKSVMAGEYDA